MTIRTKLAILLSVGIAAATAVSGAVFVNLQQKTLRAAQREKTRLLLTNIRRMAQEAQLAKDPLMVFDQLTYIRRDRMEVHHFRLRMGGRWQDVGGKPPQTPAGGISSELLRIAPSKQGLADGMDIEVQFVRSVLERREQEALDALIENASSAGAMVALAGLLLSFIFAHTMTRRIVHIEEAVEAIGEGRFGHVARTGGSDEIARLARGVNQMSERLKELEQMKKTFIASVTHELRSPLGAIEAHIKMMLSTSDNLNGEDKESLKRILRNTSRLEHFVTGLLEMSKIERGKLEYHPKKASFSSVVDDTVTFLKARAEESHIELIKTIQPGLPDFSFDSDLIAQVVTNLVSNAIKFTPADGRVRILVKRNGEEGVECEVADTGVGIAPQALERIFTPFERVENPMHATGAGLGLAISKAIVEMHDGTIGVKSVAGHGSQFYFRIPFKTPEPSLYG